MYLEPIFSAQDIQKQLPSEYRAFDHVHKQLKEIMRRTKDRPNALQTASNPCEMQQQKHVHFGASEERVIGSCVQVHVHMIVHCSAICGQLARL